MTEDHRVIFLGFSRGDVHTCPTLFIWDEMRDCQVKAKTDAWINELLLELLNQVYNDDSRVLARFEKDEPDVAESDPVPISFTSRVLRPYGALYRRVKAFGGFTHWYHVWPVELLARYGPSAADTEAHWKNVGGTYACKKKTE